MRVLLAPLAITLLGFGANACGEASKPAGSAPTTASSAAATTGHPETVTTTATGLVFDSDDDPVRFYGHEADTAQRQAITALVKSYYAAAAKDDGAKACRMIHPLIAEAIPEDYEEQPALRGRTCAVVMSKLLKQLHGRHAPESATPRESATLKVIGVRVEGGIALVLLRFADAPEPDHIAVHLEGHSWKIWELFGNHMP
jgi:hypothetical protein